MNGSRNERWFEARITGPVGGDVLAPDPRQPEVEVEERLQHAADEPVHQRVDALVAGAGVQGRVLHDQRYPGADGSLQLSQMALNGTRTLRGALAGAAGAAVWAAQQPLDKKVFGVEYDDVELLGKLFTREPAWLPIGLAAHVFNGAAFGAIYANVAPSLPGPAPGAAACCSGWRSTSPTWPATLLLDRFHPAAGDFPALWGNPRAFAQATWRHALFGFVLGELERRLNPPGRRTRADRRRRGRLQRPRLGRAPGGGRRAGRLTPRSSSPARAEPASPEPQPRGRTSRPRRPATRSSTSRARAAWRRPARRRARARRGPRRRARGRLPPRRARPRRRVVARAGGLPARQPGDDAAPARGGARRGARGRGRGGRLLRALRPAGRAAGRRVGAAAARRTPTRSRRRAPTCSPASSATRTACGSCAPARSTTPGRARSRSTRSPRSRARSRLGSRRARTRSGSSPATPTRGATTPTCATSCAPTASSPSAREPGIYNVCSGRPASAAELLAALGPRDRRRASTTRSTRSCGARTR